MVHDILFGFWFFLPAALANMAPIFAAKMPWLKRYSAPMDFGRSFRGKRILGNHKTWRGLMSGIVVATIIFGAQKWAATHFGWAAWLTDQVDYSELSVLLMGLLFAIGALGGDAVKSFFKRQRGTPPGQKWFPWDQLDSIIGTAVVIAPFVSLSFWQYVLFVVLWFSLHLASTYSGWLLGLKDSPV
ncbi:MAG TPA: CDP-archaeol synthase [Candidatus Saccharimonadales bacterium]|nr:CDP-archaeol synthase [Candidatus Saccharimonadales bacterium]